MTNEEAKYIEMLTDNIKEYERVEELIVFDIFSRHLAAYEQLAEHLEIKASSLINVVGDGNRSRLNNAKSVLANFKPD